MNKLNIVDLMVCFLCMTLVIPLVNHYLKSPQFSRQFRIMTIFGGLLWLAYALINEAYVYSMLGIWSADSRLHWDAALLACEKLSRGHWPFATPIPYSNEAYRAYLAISHYLTGVTGHGIAVVNALFSFMGGLTLARAFTMLIPQVRIPKIAYSLVIFFPSVVFWTTANLKEGLVYWSICQLISILPLIRTLGIRSISVPFVLGALGLHVLRPHVFLIWAAGIATAVFLGSRNRTTLLAILLIVMPIGMFGVWRSTKQEIKTPEQVMDQLTTQGKYLDDPKQGSHIDYGKEGPVFFVSGLTSIFFRPFPWKIDSVRVAICAIETWALTLVVVFVWLKSDIPGARWLLRNPLVQATFVATLLFSILFTYFPNEGLVARQRIQLVPGLLALFLLPMMLKRYSRMIAVARRRSKAAAQTRVR